MTAFAEPAPPIVPLIEPALYAAGPAARERTLWAVLAETERRHPGALALDDTRTRLTYRELLAEVEQLGEKLAAEGIGAGDRVGVRVPSGTVDLYVCILAVLSVGAAYVPVDADDPEERAQLVFGEAGVCGVLTEGRVLVMREPGSGRSGAPTPDDDAWIIFTSGSTGKPKGVAVSHRAAAAFVDAEAELFLPAAPIGPGDRVLAGLSVAFDASCEEMWLAWRHGGCLVAAPRSLVRAGMDLGPWLVEQGITVVSTVPTLAALWPAEALDGVRLLIFGGEACPPELAERLVVDGREVWNTYGPTEATVVATAARLTATGPVLIGLPLRGWELAVVDQHGEVVGMGETGELVIGGAGLGRYLDPVKDAEKFAPLPSVGWARAYRSGDLVRAEAAGLAFVGRADEQVKLGGRRIELGEIDAALQALPNVVGAAAAVRNGRLLVGYVVGSKGPAGFDAAEARSSLAESLPAALVPLIAEVDDLPTRTSGKVDRAALPWPLPNSGSRTPAVELSGVQAWLAERWGVILGAPATSPDDDFFAAGGSSLAAAQLVSVLRADYPSISVSDLYQHPTLGAQAVRLQGLSASRSTAREVTPTPRRTGVVQLAVLLALKTLLGLKWLVGGAAVGNVLAATGVLPWLPTVSWWALAAGWLLLFSPAGRVAIAAGGARVLRRGVQPGDYPRGGRVHLRLWAAERLAETIGATNLSGSWLTYYARALGASISDGADVHSLPPVTGLLKIGRNAAIEPEVDLSGHWLDGDVLHVGAIRIGTAATIGARTTLFPGAAAVGPSASDQTGPPRACERVVVADRSLQPATTASARHQGERRRTDQSSRAKPAVTIGKNSIIAPGSGVTGNVPAGQRWSGVPATRSGKAGHPWPEQRPRRTRRWSAAYAVTSSVLDLLPLIAAAPALLVAAAFLSGATPATALGAALLAVPAATVTWFVSYALLTLAGVRLLGIGLREGHHALHSRIAWQAWTTERLMDAARQRLFPLYASLFTPVWLRALGMKVGRRVEASTVLALPSMTKVGDGAFLADDTMIATYELGGGWLRLASARVGKRAFLGNSGMTAPGRAVPKRGLVGVLSSTPKRAKKGDSYLGMPPMKLPRAAAATDEARTFNPPRRLMLARGLIELCRIVPVMASVALGVLVIAAFYTLGFGLAAALGGVVLLAAGLAACALAAAAKWLLVGRFRAVEHPLWSSFVWRNELADAFVEMLAVPWLAGSAGGTPLMNLWLRALGAKIGRGVWSESYWLPEADLVHLGDGATVNRGCVVQTHLFHDRIMRMDQVTMEPGSTLGPHGIVLPGATIGAHTTLGPASLMMRGESVPAGTRWLGNPISAWAG